MRHPIALAVAAALVAFTSGLAFSSNEEAQLQQAADAGVPGAAGTLAGLYEQRNLIAASREVLVEAAEAGDAAAIVLLAEHDVAHGDAAAVDASLPVIRGALSILPVSDRTRIGLRLADRVIDPQVPPSRQRDWARLVVDLLAPARAQGDPEAIWRVGHLGTLGLPERQNPESASATIAKAADAGHPTASYWLARYHFDGVYVARDVAQGVRYLEKAALAGHRNAMLELASYNAPIDPVLSRFWTDTAALHEGRLAPVDPATLPRATTARRAPPPPSTTPATAPAIAPSPATTALTGAAATPLEVRNRELVLQVERLTAENAVLREQLGALKARYDTITQQRVIETASAAERNRRGLQHYAERDFESALADFRAGLAVDHAASLVNLGLLHLNGQGVPQSVDQAERLFKRASSLGNAQGSENLARLYHHGIGVVPDLERAVQWYQKAQAQGSAAAAAELATLLPSR